MSTWRVRDLKFFVKRDWELEACIVEKFAVIETALDERGRRLWAVAESRASGYGGDSLVSSATGRKRRNRGHM